MYEYIQEIGSVSHFYQNLASTDVKWHLAIPLAKSCRYQIECVCKILAKYSLWFKSYGQFSLSHNLDLGKASTNRKWYMYLAILWARSCQCHWVCNLTKKSLYDSRDGTTFTFSEFGLRQSLDRRHVSFGNPFSWVLSISMCVQIFFPNIPYVQDLWAIFKFLQFGHRQILDQWMDNDILQPLGLDLVSIDGQRKFHQTIP